MLQDKRPRNKQGEPHGYWEVHHSKHCMYIRNYVNGESKFGYYMFRWPNGKIKQEYYAR